MRLGNADQTVTICVARWELRPGVRRAGLPRQSPALRPGQRRAKRAALIKYGSIRQRSAVRAVRGVQARCVAVLFLAVLYLAPGEVEPRPVVQVHAAVLAVARHQGVDDA